MRDAAAFGEQRLQAHHIVDLVSAGSKWKAGKLEQICPNGEEPQFEAAEAMANRGGVNALCLGILRPFVERAIVRKQQSENAQDRQEAAHRHNPGNAEAVDEVAER